MAEYEDLMHKKKEEIRKKKEDLRKVQDADHAAKINYKTSHNQIYNGLDVQD